MGRNRRRFTKAFKVEAVKLVTEQGYKISEAARNLGVGPHNLRRWKQQIEKESGQAGFMTAEKEELYRLRKEVKRLQMERDILKKATTFFANLSN